MSNKPAISLKDAVRKEYIKCATKPIYCIVNYFKIENPVKGKVKFQLYPFQSDVLVHLFKNRFTIINKGRQLGISTLVAAYILYNMMFTEGFKALIIATKQEVAKNLVRKIKIMHDLCPSWLRHPTKEDNKLMLEFSDNNSSVKAISSSPDAARSEALSLLVFDEAAFISRVDEIWTASQSTVATGGRVIMLSSPSGVGTLFHRLWKDALEGGMFFPIKLPWYVHPDRDQSWRDEQDELLGKRAAAQENDCEFMTSGHTVVDSEIIFWYENNYKMPPIEKRGAGGSFWIWKYPQEGASYVIPADISRGDGSDFSTFHIIDIDTLEQVAEFKGNPETKPFAHLLMSAASEYNMALIAPENTGLGWSVVQEIIDAEYPNLFYTYKNDPYVDPEKYFNKSYDQMLKEDMTPGFTTSVKTRPVMISKLSTYFREKAPIIRSSRCIYELYTFIWDNHKPQASEGNHDDLVMSLAIAFWVRDTALRMRALGIDFTKKLLSSYDVPIYKQTDNNKKPMTMDLPDGTKEDLGWLL